MENKVIERLELLLSELANAAKEQDIKKGKKLVPHIIEEIRNLRDKNIKTQFIIELINLIPFLGEEAREFIREIEVIIKDNIDLSDDNNRYIYSRFLAVLSQILFELGDDPRDYLSEAEELLYDLAVKKGLVKEYASFINLYYSPILRVLGDLKKAFKALEIATDELYYNYRQTRDESVLALLGEINLYKAELLYEMGNIKGAREVLEDTFEIFKMLGKKYREHLVTTCKNLVSLYDELRISDPRKDECVKILRSS